MSLSSGTHLSSYIVLSSLGSGGMGEVYKARDPRLNRLVAIKVLPVSLQTDPAALARFEREARVLAGLAHPHIVAIHDVGRADECPFVVMELLEGETLGSLLARGALAPSRAVALASQVAQALGAAHDRGIVHRDLKPSNVFVGKGDHVKLLDFGLAKELQFDLAESVSDAVNLPGRTLEGTLLGTVGYMAPEQVRGEPADARSDLFALGVLLLEMLTGKQAFTGDSAVEVLHAILREDPLAGRELPTDLRPVVERLLAKDPDQRFQSTKDLAFTLGRWGQPQILASPKATSSFRSWPWRLTAIVGVALAIGATSWAWVRGSHVPPSITWTLITSRPTLITSARFAPDGRSLAFSAQAPDGRMEISTFSEHEPFPRETGLHGKVLAVDKGGELYFAGENQLAFNPGAALSATCLRWKGEGTDPQPWIEDAEDVDRSLDGSRLAILRMIGGPGAANVDPSATLECPPGHVLYRSIWMACPRWSPDGASLAFVDHAQGKGESGWGGRIIVLDAAGQVRYRSEKLEDVRSLAWAPDGQHIAFTRGDAFHVSSIWLLDFHGGMHQLLSDGNDLHLMDLDSRGHLLLASTLPTIHESLERKGDLEELRLPFPQPTGAACLSPDGSKAAFGAQEGEGAHWIYLRDQTTGRLTRFTSGMKALAFSPDNRWLMVERRAELPHQDLTIALVPLGPGSEIQLQVQGLRGVGHGMLADPDSPIVSAATADGSPGYFLLSPSAPPRRIAHDFGMALQCLPMAPGGAEITFAFSVRQGLMRGSIRKDSWQAVGGVLKDRVPVGWDPRSGEILVVRQGQWPDFDQFLNAPRKIEFERLDPRTLRLRKDRVLEAPDVNHFRLCVSPASTLFEWTEYTGHLYIVKGALHP